MDDKRQGQEWHKQIVFEISHPSPSRAEERNSERTGAEHTAERWQVYWQSPRHPWHHLPNTSAHSCCQQTRNKQGSTPGKEFRHRAVRDKGKALRDTGKQGRWRANPLCSKGPHFRQSWTSAGCGHTSTTLCKATWWCLRQPGVLRGCRL